MVREHRARTSLARNLDVTVSSALGDE